MINKVLFVEDGSVDVEEVARTLPYIPIVIYRQGSCKPEFVDLPGNTDAADINILAFVQERALSEVELVLKKHIIGASRTATQEGPEDEKIYLSAESIAAIMREIRDRLGDLSDSIE